MNDALFTPRGLVRALTPGDLVVCGVVLAGAVAAFAFTRSAAASATHALVTVGREEAVVLPLAVPAVTRIDGRHGPVVLEVRGGAIRVRESSCPNHVCIAMGEKRRGGEILACAPNAVVVRLTGGAPDPDAPDAVSR